MVSYTYQAYKCAIHSIPKPKIILYLYMHHSGINLGSWTHTMHTLSFLFFIKNRLAVWSRMTLCNSSHNHQRIISKTETWQKQCCTKKHQTVQKRRAFKPLVSHEQSYCFSLLSMMDSNTQKSLTPNFVVFRGSFFCTGGQYSITDGTFSSSFEKCVGDGGVKKMCKKIVVPEELQAL